MTYIYIYDFVTIYIDIIYIYDNIHINIIYNIYMIILILYILLYNILGVIIAVFLSAPIPVVFPHNIPHWKLNKHIFHIAIIIIIFILITCSLFLAPYSNQRPKRLWIQHIKRLIAIPSPPKSLLTTTTITATGPVISPLTNTLTADTATTTTNILTATSTAIPMESKDTNEIVFEKKATVYKEDCGLWISSFDYQGILSYGVYDTIYNRLLL